MLGLSECQSTPDDAMSETTALQLPGRLGNAHLTLLDDPRADARMLAAMEVRGRLDPAPPLPINVDSSMDIKRFAESVCATG